MRLLTATAILIGASLFLSGCQMGPQPSPTAVPASPTATSSTTASARPTPVPTATPAPVLIPAGSATQNLPYFNYVIQQAIAKDPQLNSHDVAIIVSQSGFAANTVQFTFSRTAVGLVADSVDIAVLWAGQCLIGQYGPAVPDYHGIVLPALAQGGCLIGSQVQPL